MSTKISEAEEVAERAIRDALGGITHLLHREALEDTVDRLMEGFDLKSQRVRDRAAELEAKEAEEKEAAKEAAQAQKAQEKEAAKAAKDEEKETKADARHAR